MAEYYIEDREYVVRVATKHFKGPEILLEHAKYDYALDMWALGCILASIIFMKDPFFQGDDNKDMVIFLLSIFLFSTERSSAHICIYIIDHEICLHICFA